MGTSSDCRRSTIARGIAVGCAAALFLSFSAAADIDLEVVFNGPAQYTPGTVDNSYTLTVTNNGSDPDNDATVLTAFPGTVALDWTCAADMGSSCAAASGMGNINAAGHDIAAGESIVFAIDADYASSMTADPLDVDASATTSESTPVETTATASSTLDLRSDLAVTNSGPATAVAGLSATFTVEVTNNGPSDAANASINNILASELTFASASAPCDGGFPCDPGTIAVGSAVSVQVNLNVDSAALGDLEYTVEVATGNDTLDPDANNNAATATIQTRREADIEVAKNDNLLPEPVGVVNPGESFRYDITVTNNGPSDVGHAPGDAGIVLTDIFPIDLQADPNECSVEGGTAPCSFFCPSDTGVAGNYDRDNCPSSVETVDYFGNIDPNRPPPPDDIGPPPTLRLAAGSSTTIQVFVKLSGGVSNGEVITNTASVAIDSDDDITELDPDIGNSSSDDTEAQIATDLRVEKTDDVMGATPGNQHSYTVTVFNDGVQGADNVNVVDTLPLFAGAGTAGFVPGSISWQCRAFDNACCNHGSSQCGLSAPTSPVFEDQLDQGIDLPGGSRVEFTITGELDAESAGTLVNTASATLPPEVIEVDPGNNSATDNDTEMAAGAALSIAKELVDITPEDGPPFTLTYAIELENEGPSFAADVRVEDPLNNPLLDNTTAAWTCSVVEDPAGATNCVPGSVPLSGSGPLDTIIDLPVGRVVRFDLSVDTTAGAMGEVINTASATAAAGSDDVTIESSLFGESDLEIVKTDGFMQATPGTAHTYDITVSNNGPDAVFGATVTDEFPPELENVAWTCEAITPIPGDLAAQFQAGPAGGAGGRLVTSSDGRHAYQIRAEANSVIAYLRNNVPGAGFGAIGVLETETDGADDGGDAGAAVENMGNPVDIALSPDGRQVYVLSNPDPMDDGQNAIVVFSRSVNPAAPNFGELSFATAETEGLPDIPRRIAVTSENIYVSGDAGDIAIYQRNQATGLPAFEEIATADVPPNPGPLAVDRGDDLLFAGSTSDTRVAVFVINTDDSMGDPIGRLSHLASLDDARFGALADFALFPAASHLYTAGSPDSVTFIDYTDDDLDDVPDPTLEADYPVALPRALTVAPDGEHVLVVGDDDLTSFRRLLEGGLTSEAVLSADTPDPDDNPALQNPVDVAVTSDGRHVLVASAAGVSGTRPLGVYSRRAPDPLFAFIETDRAADQSVDGLMSPTDVAISADGGHVYAVSPSDGSIAVFARTADAGTTDATAGQHLVFQQAHFDGVDGVSGMSEPEFVLVSPDDASVFVSSEAGDSIAVFDRDDDQDSPDFGKLTFRGAFFDGADDGAGNTVEGLAGARGMAMDSASKYLYVAGGFDAAIVAFERDNDPGSADFGRIEFLAQVDDADVGVAGLAGIRDLVVGPDDQHLLGVSNVADSLVVFRIESESPDAGTLVQQQQQTAGVGDGPMALDVSPDGDHVYVAAQNSDSVGVFRRVTDMSSPMFGDVIATREHFNLADGIEFMDGPRDIEVSGDNKRVYVVSQFDNAVLVFDRDRNPNSADFGTLAPVEVSRDDIDGVDGLDNTYALAVSPDFRNVYVAGFDDRALSSFVLGIGSVCSGGGSGAIDDRVTLGNGGVLLYRISADIRPDAFGTLENTATVELPPRFTDPVPNNNQSTDDDTVLVPSADLSLVKTNERVSVVAGEPVTYEVTVTNLGPSNLGSAVGSPVTITDLFDANPGFAPGTATWSCLASSSGALSFVDSVVEELPVEGEPEPLDLGLAGVADLALVADPDGSGPLPGYLASVAVTDDALTLFERDGLGALSFLRTVLDGDTLDQPVTGLGGARAVAASADGRFVYVASRVDDAISVFALADDGTGGLELTLEQTVQGFTGLDQASHLVLSVDGEFLYVAGTNDDAIAVFDRDPGSGLLSFVESEREGVDDGGDAGAMVSGLDGVAHLLISADGEHLYAVSATAEAIARFDRDASSGALSFAAVQTEVDLGTDLAGAASADLDATGRHLYVAASAADRIVVLARDDDALSSDFGALTLVGEALQGSGGVNGLLSPRGLRLSPDGLHLYVTGQISNSVTWFIRDPDAGALQFGGVLSNQSSFVDGLAGASALVIDDALDQIYVAGTGQAGIARFRRSNDSLCPVSGTGDLNAIDVDIAAGGSVSFEITVDVAAEGADELENIALVSTEPGVDPDATNNDMTDTDQVEVVADLSITKDDGLAEYDGLDGTVAVTGTATGVYTAARDDNAIGIFSRIDNPGAGDHGSLDFLGAVRNGVAGVSGLTDVNSLALAHDQGQLYAVSPADNTLVAFERDPADGDLAFLELQQNGVFGVTGLGGAADLALSPDDEHLYVASRLANAVAVFARQADDTAPDYGRLTFLGDLQNGVDGVTNLTEPAALAVAPDGRHVYAVSPVDQSVVVFQRNIESGSSGFGTLSFVTSYSQGVGGVAGLAGAVDVVLSADGTRLYVLGRDAGTLALFERDPASGELTFIEFKQDGTAGTTGLAGAGRMRLSPDGAHLYVAGTASDAIVHFDVLAGGSLEFATILSNGEELPNGAEVLGLDGAADLLVSPDGDQVYAGASIDDALATLQRQHDADPAMNSGELQFSDALLDGLGGIAPGEVVTYRITVENLGPSDVTGLAQATVVDDFPDSFGSVNWTCTPTAIPAAACTLNGSGSINDTVTLEAGARLTYEAVATVREDASGTLVNTASVTGTNVQDPNIANNTATDDDTVLSPSVNLVTDVDDGLATATPGAPLTYTVSVSNIGPSFAGDVVVSDQIPPALFGVEWACAATPVEGLLSAVQQQAAPLDQATDLLVPGSGQFAYAAGTIGGEGALVAFRRDSVSGELSVLATYLESDMDTDIEGIQGAADLVASADGRFLYVAAPASDSIAVFERALDTGLLEFVTHVADGSAGVNDLGGVSALLLGPAGVFLYAAGTLDDAITRFAIDSGDGTLTFVDRIGQSDAGVDGLNGVAAMAWSQDHLLAVAADNASLAAFERNPATGALSFAHILQNFELGPPDPAPPLDRPVDLLANEAQVLVAAQAGNAVAEFEFDPARDPAFTLVNLIEDGVDGIAGMTGPASLAWAERQQRLYVASGDGESIHLFSLRGEAPELLRHYTTADFAVLAGIGRIHIPELGGPLYSLSGAGDIGVLARQRGSFCPLGGARELGSHDAEIAPEGGELTYTVNGTVFANAGDSITYTVEAASRFVERELNAGDNVDDDVDALVPAPDLAVTKTDGLSEVVAGTGINYTIGLANGGPSDALGALLEDAPPLHPEDPGLVPGTAAWSCSANPPLLSAFTLDAGAIPALAGAAGIAFSPDGAELLAVSPDTDTLLVFAVQPDGGLALETTVSDGQALGDQPEDVVAGMDGASAVARSRDGRNIYVAGRLADSLVALGRNQQGELEFLQQHTSGTDGVAGLMGPESVVISPDQRFVYVAAAVSDAITVFARDEDSGLLTFVERVKDGFGTIVPDSNVIRGVRRLHVADDGENLYAVAPESEAIAVFSIAADSGVLTYLEALQQGDPGIDAMAGALDLAAAPGDQQFYVAAPDSDAVNRFDRDPADGGLVFAGAVTGVAGMTAPAAIAGDAAGTRLYVATAGGRVHVFARDWLDGSLEHRAVLDDADGIPVGPADLAYLDAPAGLYIAAPVPGALARFDELALSRCLTDSGTTDVLALSADFGAGGFGEAAYSATVHPSARGDLVNSATLTPAVGTDPDPGNNTGTDVTTVVAVSDIAVVKTGPAQAVAGETISYEIQVSNDGPSNALGIMVNDLLPAPLQGQTWTCSVADPAGLSVCPAAGNGPLGFAADVEVGNPLTVVLMATIDPAFVGAMTNTAQLTPEPGAVDPDSGDHESSVVTDVRAEPDIAVTKSNGVDDVTAGEATVYTIDVVNLGPSDAPIVEVADPVPPELTDVSWSCAGAGGATCPASGLGPLLFDASIPAGGSLSIELSATVAASATGDLANTAAATVNGDAIDPDPANNSATDTDTILTLADLSLDIDDPFDPFDTSGPDDLPYLIAVTNAGPSDAQSVEVTLNASLLLTEVGVAACQNADGDTIECDFGVVPAGETMSLDAAFGGLPAPPATLDVIAEVSAATTDPDGSNNQDTESTELVAGTDVAATIGNGETWLSPAQAVAYDIEIRNLGSQSATAIGVSVPVASQLLGATWACTPGAGAACAPSGSGDIVDSIQLDSGEMVTYTVTATVDPDADLTPPTSVDQAVDASLAGDINPLNNSAVDMDPLRVEIFVDGFEDAQPVRGPALALAGGDAASCLDFVLAADTRPRAAGLGPLMLLQGVSSDGERLVWLDSLATTDGPWLQLAHLGESGFEASGWLPWDRLSGLRVRSAPAGVSLHAGDEPLWLSRQISRAQPANWWRPPMVLAAPWDGVWMVEACDES